MLRRAAAALRWLWWFPHSWGSLFPLRWAQPPPMSLGTLQPKASGSSSTPGSGSMHSGPRKKRHWREERERLLKMTLDERRRVYVRDFVPLQDVMSWREEVRSRRQDEDELSEEAVHVTAGLSEKVSLYRGDITLLEIDAIVNAANSSLLGGGGVDGCIHRAAGPCLLAECRSLSGCETGEAKITCGYDLPAKYVIHTVGPIASGRINQNDKEDLANCYRSSLKLTKENNIRSVAFPCISTGIYGFPNEPAAIIALNTIKEWLKKNHSEMDRVILCVFLEIDYKIYKKKLTEIFPLDADDEEDVSEETGPLEQKARSPPSKKGSVKKSDDGKDGGDGDSNIEEKKSTEEKESPEVKEITEETESTQEIEDLGQKTDEENPPTEAGQTEEKIESCLDKEPSEDSKKLLHEDSEVQSMDEQEQSEGHQNDAMIGEMQDSQRSYMEVEDVPSYQGDETESEAHSLCDGKEGQDSPEEKGKESSELIESQPPNDAESIILNSDAEMNSQLENAAEPTESQPQEQLKGGNDEKKEQ